MGGRSEEEVEVKESFEYLKVSHQDWISFQSAFHTGHFYRAIQSQDVREMTGGRAGL